jgi:hypothetical protein
VNTSWTPAALPELSGLPAVEQERRWWAAYAALRRRPSFWAVSLMAPVSALGGSHLGGEFGGGAWGWKFGLLLGATAGTLVALRLFVSQLRAALREQSREARP